MTNYFLEKLRCPLCGASLKTSKIIDESEKELEWGTIICTECATKFPVAFGIPIIKPPQSHVDVTLSRLQNNVLQKGLFVRDLVKKIELNKIEEVKRELLIYRRPRATVNGRPRLDGSMDLNTRLTQFLPDLVVKLIGKRILYYLYWFVVKLSFQDLRLRKGEEKIYKEMINQNSAMGFLDLYYNQLMHSLIYNYLAFRFGQPRYLGAISILSTFNGDQKPTLDVACGTGHLIYFLTTKYKKLPVIGLDRNFVRLYIAKRFVAPEGNYFCAETEQPLPFQNDTFGGILCSDAFQYFTQRTSSAHEMKRVLTHDGILSIIHVPGHPDHEKGHAIISAGDLKNHFKEMPNIVLKEEELVNRYIQKLGPDLSKESPMEESNMTKWISIVASRRKDYFRDYGEFKDWPHATGQINLNPLYHEEGMDEKGNFIFKFKFPSEWYEFEDHDWMKYAPETITISPETMEAISKGIRTPEVDDLISKWVVFGMPEKYLAE